MGSPKLSKTLSQALFTKSYCFLGRVLVMDLPYSWVKCDKLGSIIAKDGNRYILKNRTIKMTHRFDILYFYNSY